MDEMAKSVQKSLFTIGEITSDLAHPLFFRLLNDPRDLDFSVLMSITKRTKYRTKPDRVITSTLKKSVAAILGNDVSSPALSPQKRLPRHSPFSVRIESMLEKDPFDRISTDLVSQVVERSSDCGVAPARILAGHSEHQLPYFGRGSRTTGASALAPVILSRDQLTVPSEKSIRGDQGLYFEEPLSANLLGLQRESSTLLISEAESLPARLLSQDAVFLLEIFDHVLLVAIDPTSEDQH